MKNFLLLTLSVFIFSCNNQDKNELRIDGLWLVKKVKVGNKELTPIARWMKFNSDSTQTSGNGWLQHSIGSWSFNIKSQLSIINANGLIDNSDPFLVNLSPSKMIWNRVEDGQNVQVFLERIDKIPASGGNKLMGLWKLNEVNSQKIESNKTLYFAWDNRYIKQFKPSKKEYGIYKIHGHKSELQMVNYGNNTIFKYYNFVIIEDNLVLKSIDNKEELKLIRIHQFLQ